MRRGCCGDLGKRPPRSKREEKPRLRYDDTTSDTSLGPGLTVEQRSNTRPIYLEVAESRCFVL